MSKIALYLWITVPTPSIEPGLMSHLVNRGYTVSALSCDGKTTHWDNSFCALIALKIEKEMVEKSRAPHVALNEILGLFKELKAALLSIVIAQHPPDAAWGIGHIPSETQQKVDAKEERVSPLLTEEPFG